MLKDVWRLLVRNPFTSASILSGWLWSLCLWAPGDTLTRPTYRYMGEVAPEWVWTSLFMVTAGLQSLRLTYRITPKVFPYEFALKLWAAFLWTTVGVLCIIAQWPLAAAVSDTLVIAIAAITDVARVKPCQGCPHLGPCHRGAECYYANQH